jgi:Nucleoporin FG repeated region
MAEFGFGDSSSSASGGDDFGGGFGGFGDSDKDKKDDSTSNSDGGFGGFGDGDSAKKKDDASSSSSSKSDDLGFGGFGDTGDSGSGSGGSLWSSGEDKSGNGGKKRLQSVNQVTWKTEYDILPDGVARRVRKLETDVRAQVSSKTEHIGEILESCSGGIRECRQSISRCQEQCKSVERGQKHDCDEVASTKALVRREMANAEYGLRALEQRAMLMRGGYTMIGGAQSPMLPSAYFRQLVASFEERMQQYQTQIQEIDEYLATSRASGGRSSPEVLSETMRNQYAYFMAMATNAAVLHEEILQLKEHFLFYLKRRGIHDNPFKRAEEKKQRKQGAASKDKPMLPPPTPIVAKQQPKKQDDTGFGGFGDSSSSSGGGFGDSSSSGDGGFGGFGDSSSSGGGDGGFGGFGDSSSSGGGDGGFGGFGDSSSSGGGDGGFGGFGDPSSSGGGDGGFGGFGDSSSNKRDNSSSTPNSRRRSGRRRH